MLNYLIRSDNADFVLGQPVQNGLNTHFTKAISQPGNEGKVYRFRVAA